MATVLSSEFFWGIIIGLILSFVGGWIHALFTARIAKKSQKELVVRFCLDTVKNVRGVIEEMDSTRERTLAIHHDFLALVDVEINIYGRNREHLIHLPDVTRDQIRKFMNECAIKRAEIVAKLDQFYRINGLAKEAYANSRDQEGARLESEALAALGEAQKAGDRLVAIASGASKLTDELAKL